MYKKFIVAFMIVGVISVLIFPMKESKGAFQLERRGNNLIRFHVLANSDNPEDQLLKLKVRDKIIAAMGDTLETSSGIEETRNILRENLLKIEEVAEEEITANGENYKVSAALVEDTFPTRRYGGVVFPAGKYEALKVVIGEGEGQNWWCVMFPPLCFVDVKNGLTDERTQRELKTALTEEEYTLVYNASNKGELPLQLRSKIVEVYQTSKNRLSRFAATF
ncbi:stage II sporulation protein R [Clostridium aceticum]|uniref:Stage II sporulation protein R n=1 Tax=Clostridium aceticum TaxID=84022 RepID=A0A0D8I5W2_9CLOT|nr:stage II sporulation protein R [Clostridium aceticum]AKL97128.1 stage II sporulation protein R [Clostridium aceticum]KJF25402.1 stage II sporulation protein R [Clostridium aceticum]